MLVWTLKRCRSRPRPRSPSPSPPVPLPLAAAPCGAVPSGMLTTWLSWALPRPSAQALLARCAARARAAPGAPEREWAESPPTPCFSSPVPKWARKWMKTALGQVSPCLSRLFKAFFPWISERTAANRRELRSRSPCDASIIHVVSGELEGSWKVGKSSCNSVHGA